MADVIRRNILSIVEKSSLACELIVILDDCTDDSEAEITRAVEELAGGGSLTRALLIQADVPLFETACDAIGISLSKAPYIIEVQADMLLMESAWDASMVRVLEEHDDIFSVSGRGCHVWLSEMPPLKRPTGLARLRREFARYFQRMMQEIGKADHSRFTFFNWDFFGRCGLLIECSVPKRARGHIYLSETVMRGPWAFSRSKYDSLGGLDSMRFYLGHDDHDLSFRAWSQFGWRSAYLPLDFASPLNEGATRQKKTDKQVAEMSAMATLYAKATDEFAPRKQPGSRPIREIRSIDGRKSGRS